MSNKPEGFDSWTEDQKWGYLRGLTYGRIEGREQVLARIKLNRYQEENSEYEVGYNSAEEDLELIKAELKQKQDI